MSKSLPTAPRQVWFWGLRLYSDWVRGRAAPALQPAAAEAAAVAAAAAGGRQLDPRTRSVSGEGARKEGRGGGSRQGARTVVICFRAAGYGAKRGGKLGQEGASKQAGKQ